MEIFFAKVLILISRLEKLGRTSGSLLDVASIFCSKNHFYYIGFRYTQVGLDNLV
jgi:hypothetical protein